MPTSAADPHETTTDAATSDAEATEPTVAVAGPPAAVPFLPPMDAAAMDGPVEDAAAAAAAAVEAVAAHLDGSRDTVGDAEGGPPPAAGDETEDVVEEKGDDDDENEDDDEKEEGREGGCGNVSDGKSDKDDDGDGEDDPAKQRPAIRGRKDELTCRCIKSKCLKLYCDCFRRNKLCDANCVCLDCHNTEAESGPEGKRTAVMIQILKRNPHAFDNKVLEGKEDEIEVLKEKAEEERGGHPRGKRGRPRTRNLALDAATGSKRKKRKDEDATDSKIAPDDAETAAGGQQRDNNEQLRLQQQQEHQSQPQQQSQSQQPQQPPPRKTRRTRRRTSAPSIAPANLENDPELKLTPEDPTPIPFTLEEHPELQLDDSQDHSKLVHAFKQPLFPKDPSQSLAIAYSHHRASKAERSKIRKKKLSLLSELETLRNQFYAKKAELLQANALLKQSSQTVGKWTRKVFDLELAEPCTWNSKLEKLREYVQLHGGPPEHSKKVKGDDTEKALVTWITGIKIKVKKEHSSVGKYPHRIEALEHLGVTWENENEARFEVMFQKLLDYRKEMGSFRMPSLDLCKESGDEELVQLHNWVFSQVGSIRYQLKNKKVEVVKRFLDVGFSFEKWYGTNGHVFERDIKSFDVIARRYVESGGTVLDGRDPDEEEQEEKKDDGDEGVVGVAETEVGQTQGDGDNGENEGEQVDGGGGQDGEAGDTQEGGLTRDNGEDRETQEGGRAQDDHDSEKEQEQSRYQDCGDNGENQEVEEEITEEAKDNDVQDIDTAQENAPNKPEQITEGETPIIDPGSITTNEEKATSEDFVEENAAKKSDDPPEEMETIKTEETPKEIETIGQDEEMVDPPDFDAQLTDSDKPLYDPMAAELPEEALVKMEDEAANSQQLAMSDMDMFAESTAKEVDDMQLDGDLGGMEDIAPVDDDGAGDSEEMDVEDANATGTQLIV
ncbi:hypothetical protein ACHAXS_012407 [Conticribra weissflogii]